MTETNTTPDPVLVEFDNGIAFVTLNRPEKRNAMSPKLNIRMLEVLDELEADDRCGVLVLRGAGQSWSAGMDLKEYFRENDGKGRAAVLKSRRQSGGWWNRLMYFEKPTIAMVNGWCFGGAFTPLVSCDLAIAADEATFGLSEINWGILPGGNVTRAVAEVMNHRDSLYYIMTGETFGGQKAREMGLVNESVPLADLETRVRALCASLLEKNPVVLKAAKDTFKRVRNMPWEQADDYIYAKLEQMLFLDKSNGRAEGLKQFLDDKTYRPGLGAYKR
ncbi:MAG: p-hydroxycinnamoyl CoA hydratase/lyase [Alphaproteobacteria bacterium]|jgi:trans-feruloyl-CoA hydratase/vanillin synthase|uniref:p-hydroxycinnamoyl CoA hydratase/lyase n=1 Tax=Rhizobium/Agrobacterium group TaxID=227290 RepID=UPI0006B9F700|nr:MULTISPECIES: p-hydroxycinnamoyl CoA hydratase/lyase [Rhizobium/Agrobacterium group]MBU0737730.1 p-hydroxycinnamoyl CoA hydratase/lyase [Alphaproteobacteria bacterium]MDM7979280.1 p-hydroxycinnamoyl CoA hydratase/lyase [Rhizobium sp.]AOG09793.1 P-hydroxycinnamoyl CoA hydratase/lyase [Agrobacterium sp. RAC06]KPF55271.1 p-hydroxycinnamoyl CoA hydratase/lyase [Rhizobium sp. AAP116]MBU0834510.1 p-hydroxycinnamoyl CoA hydratase/lyase [Alphaproteobacteria bacterium]